MSHTTRINEKVYAVHNGDFSGNVRLVFIGQVWQLGEWMDTPNPNEEFDIEIPGEILKTLMGEWAKSEIIAALENLEL